MEEDMKEFEVGEMSVAVLRNRIMIGTEYYERCMSIRLSDIQPLRDALKQAREHISRKETERYDNQDKKVAEAWRRRTEEEEATKGKDIRKP